MLASKAFSTFGRSVASSSKQTLQPSIASTKPATNRAAFAQLRYNPNLNTSSFPFPTSRALPRSQRPQQRQFRSAPVRLNDRSRAESLIPETTPSASNDTDVDASEKPGSIPVTGERTPIGQIEQRLSITFTCTVHQCGHRSTHEFSKRSYTKGIVIVQCPGCKNRHLIADNLSWFTESEDEPRTIEQMIEAKGGKVRRGTVGVDGEAIEILS